MPDETCEPFAQGQLQLLQKKRGYRFSLDAVLLAGLVELNGQETVLELGAGCGIVSLLLARRYPGVHLTAVELQPQLADLARRNVLLNDLASQITILEADMTALPRQFPAGAFSVCISNPPYRPVASGRLNPNPEKAVARHELKGSLATVVQVAAQLLPAGGRLALIYPAWRLVHLLTTLKTGHLEPKKLVFIHSRQGEEAKLVFVEARQGGREALNILSPLVIYQEDGRYTPEVDRLLTLPPR